MRGEHLERDRPVERLVPARVDDGHAAAAELVVDPVGAHCSSSPCLCLPWPLPVAGVPCLSSAAGGAGGAPAATGGTHATARRRRGVDAGEQRLLQAPPDTTLRLTSEIARALHARRGRASARRRPRVAIRLRERDQRRRVGAGEASDRCRRSPRRGRRAVRAHRRVTSDSVGEPRRQRQWRPALAHLGLRLLDRIRPRAGRLPGSAAVSISSQAARASPSRGWPTEPGLSSQRRSGRGRLRCRPGARPPAIVARRPSASASATWLWPTSTSGAVVASRLAGRPPRSARSPRPGRAGCRGRARPRRASPAGASPASQSRCVGAEHAARPARRAAASPLNSAMSSVPSDGEVVVAAERQRRRARGPGRRTRSGAARSRRRRRGTRARPAIRASISASTASSA